MATARDVAKSIALQFDFDTTLTSMKLQKLVYYSQAWHMVWHDTPLFEEAIEAWANGPIVPSLYTELQDTFAVSLESWDWGGDSTTPVLTEDERSTVFSVLRFYGTKTAQELSDLTHQEEPWRRARQGLSPRERGTREIKLAWIHEYYSGLEPSTGYGETPER